MRTIFTHVEYTTVRVPEHIVGDERVCKIRCYMDNGQYMDITKKDDGDWTTTMSEIRPNLYCTGPEFIAYADDNSVLYVVE